MPAEPPPIDSPAHPPTRPPTHPLGPVIVAYAPVNRARARMTALLVAIGCAVLLGVALWLKPDPSGVGTHTQLGLPPCSWPTEYNLPCPTCGMTTSFALLVRGRLVAAFEAQPFGALLALATVLLLLLALRELGARKVWRINWYRVRPRWVWIGAVLLALAGWGYKILAMRGGLG